MQTSSHTSNKISSIEKGLPACTLKFSMSSFRVVAQMFTPDWRLLTATQLKPKVLGIFHMEVLRFFPKHYHRLMQMLLLQAKCGVEGCVYRALKLKDEQPPLKIQVLFESYI